MPVTAAAHHGSGRRGSSALRQMSPDQQRAALCVRLFQITWKARLNESPQTWESFEELFARAIVETALMPVRRPEKIAEYLDSLDTVADAEATTA